VTGLEVKLTPIGSWSVPTVFHNSGNCCSKAFWQCDALPLELQPLKRDWQDLNLQPIGWNCVCFIC